MGFDKKGFSERIGENIAKLKEIIPLEFFIPISQVAYRFNLDNDEMYLDFPYDESIEKQNYDLKHHPKIMGVDNNIFLYLNEIKSSDLKYILYEYEYLNTENPIIRGIYTTIPDFKKSDILENIRKAFSIIHYNATKLGHYLDNIQYEEIKTDYNNMHRLLFVLDEFKVDCALTKEERLSYLNITFNLSDNHDINDEKTIKVLKHLIFDLKLFGETLLINPLSEEKKEDVVNKRLKEKIRDDRHTILNFLNAISHKTRFIEDNQLRYGSEILFRILEDVVTDESERQDVWAKHEYDNPYQILEKLTEYFKGDNSKRLDLDYQIYGDSNFKFLGMQGYAYLTIMYNLIHNAHKSRIYETFNEEAKNYRIILNVESKSLITQVITAATLEERIISFLNEELTIEDAGIKKSGGIAISKKLAKQNGWILKASNDMNRIENEFSLEIKL